VRQVAAFGCCFWFTRRVSARKSATSLEEGNAPVSANIGGSDRGGCNRTVSDSDRHRKSDPETLSRSCLLTPAVCFAGVASPPRRQSTHDGPYEEQPAEEEQAVRMPEEGLIEEYAQKGVNVAAMQIPAAAKDLSAAALGGTFLVCSCLYGAAKLCVCG
jgi:hypothetical protein